MDDGYDLAALAALEAKATKGPWEPGTVLTDIMYGPEDGRRGCQDAAFRIHASTEDKAFVAAARNALPAMIADLREAGALLEAMEWFCVRAWVHICPCCKLNKDDGHASDCRLDAWLKRMGRTG